MKSTVIFIFIALIFLMPAMTGAVCTQEKLTGNQIMEKVDTRPIPVDMKAETVMKLIDKRGSSRERRIRSYRYGDDKQIMWFLEPADVKGSSFLRISYDDRDDDMWLYLPAFGKVRRIASHTRKNTFMGSDFTFEDMGNRKLKEYTYKLLREEPFGDHECWVVESVPEKNIVTDYSKITSWIRKDGYTPVKEEFYDKRGNLKKVKTIEFFKLENYWIAESMKMEDLKSSHITDISFESIEVDTGLEESMFDTRSLKRIH